MHNFYTISLDEFDTNTMKRTFGGRGNLACVGCTEKITATAKYLRKRVKFYKNHLSWKRCEL
jgi:hypothetical protein